MLHTLTLFAFIYTFSILTPLMHSQSTMNIQPSTIPTSIKCSDTPRQQCIQLYYDNVSLYTNSNFSQVFLQICGISQPDSSLLCGYTRYLVTCISDEIYTVITSGVDSRNLDGIARNVLQNCAANTTSIPMNQNVLSNFAVTMNSIGYYGYYINQGLFSNLPFLNNLTSLVLSEINSLCVSTAANSFIVDSFSLQDYIALLGVVANLSEISCTLYCPTCPTRSISTVGDSIVAINELCVDISNTSLVMNCLCGNGKVGIGELCDDGNRMNNDGCNNMCGIESGWDCVETNTLPSRCSNCGNGMLEFEEECDHNDTGCDACRIQPLFNCTTYGIMGFTNCSKIVLDTNTTDHGSVDSYYMTSENVFSLSMDLIDVTDIDNTVNYTITFSKLDNPDIQSTTNPLSVNLERLRDSLGVDTLSLMPTLTVETDTVFVVTYSITEAFLLAHGKTIFDYKACLLSFINSTQVDLTDRPVGKYKLEYVTTATLVKINTRRPSTFSPIRTGSQVRVQLSVSFTPLQDSGKMSGTASIFITSIGTDDTPPEINLQPYTPIFYEGNISIAIVHPLSTVTDVNDRFYLIQSLEIILTDTPDGDYEFISLSSVFEDFSVNFANATKTLTITGAGTGANYTQILRSVVYQNTKGEPTTGSRRIFIEARDTEQDSTTQMQALSVININDLPVITLSRVEVTFVENGDALLLDEFIHLSDEDLNPSIQYAYIQVTPFDPDESISFLNGTQNIQSINNTFLELTMSLSIETVQEIFRRVYYIHISDNPTSGARVVTFTVIDDNGGRVSAELTLNVQPVNDRPVVELSNTLFTYQEDSPPVLIGSVITLSDVDSSTFYRMVFQISNIPMINYFQNELLFDGSPNLILGMGPDFVNNIFTFRYTLTNNRPISDYQSLTESIRYNNTFLDDFTVIEGTRVITITAFDSDNVPSLPVTLTIQLTAQNDAPLLDIGSGLGMNWTFTFTEYNSSSIDDPSNEEHIVLQPFLEIFDEENDTIASLTVTLNISNGQLDPNEFIFVRSPLQRLFDNTSDIQSYSTGSIMYFYGNASKENYTNILRALLYTNDEDEPSLYPLGDRFITITITDVRGASSSVYSIVDTIPINDNKPVITLRLRSGQTSVATRRRREIAAFDALNLTAYISNRIPFSYTKLRTGDIVEIQFVDEITQVNLAHRKQLESLLHFNHEVYNELPKYSYWKDGKTLVIVFTRIDDHYSAKITDIQKFNLSIIFKDCNLPYETCTNLCAKKTPLACAKGETTVIVSFHNPKLGVDKQNKNYLLTRQNLKNFLIVVLAICTVCIITNFIFKFYKNIEKTETKPTNEKEKIVGEKVFHHPQPKTDEEQIQSLKGRKNKKKSNPRATPNILNYTIMEN